MVCTESCSQALKSVYISIYFIVVFIQIPWQVYFIIKFFEARSRSAQLKRIDDGSGGFQNLLQKYKNTKILYKYFIAATTFELLTILLTIFNNILTVTLPDFYLHCEEYYFILYLYASHLIGFLSIVCFMSTIEVLNLTTNFAINIFILNRNGGKKQKVRIFIMKLILLVSLALSGIGMGIAYILVVVLLIRENIKYYQYSRELYRKLKKIYQDVKYEFGSTHIQTRSARMNLLHYKRFTLWFSMVVFVVMIVFILSIFSIPFRLVGTPCILETITRDKYNSTILDSIHYKGIMEGESILYTTLVVSFMILFIPFYTLYSLYYLCDKLLFVNVYPHRYHVGESVGSDTNALLIHK